MTRGHLALACLAMACAEPTGIRFHVDTDLAVPSELAEVRIRIEPLDPPFETAEGEPLGLDARVALDAVERPIVIGIAPYEGDASRTVRMRIEPTSTTACALAPVEHVVGFTAGRVVDVHASLSRDCCGVTCDGGERCEPGPTCVPVRGPEPTIDGGTRDAGPDATVACSSDDDQCSAGVERVCHPLTGAWVERTCPLGCDPSEPHCLRVVPSNVDADLLDPFAPDAIIATNVDVDTTACDAPFGVASVEPQLVGDPVCVVRVGRLDIAAGATVRVTGTLGLVVLAGGSVTIDGTIDVSASGATPGPGGFAGGIQGEDGEGFGSFHAGEGVDEGGGSEAPGGGGGGNCGRGGRGGTSGNSGGDGGGVFPVAAISRFYGGSGGGGGRAPDGGAAGAGGAGGGALQITANTGIVLNGRVLAGGGGGFAGPSGGGGGGGSGGSVWLEAPAVSAGPLGAIGASGGGGGGGGSAAGAGANGGLGGIETALGGAATAPAGPGGPGSSSASLAGALGRPGTGAGAGGGGGGAGCVIVRNETATLPAGLLDRSSPAAPEGIIALPLRARTCFSNEVAGGRSTICTDRMLAWSDAQNDCVRRGGQLAVVDDATRAASLVALATRAGRLGVPLWIGLDDRATEGDYRWIDGAPLGSYRAWWPGEPNDSGMMGESEDCAAMGRAVGPDEWNDDVCTFAHPFPCDAVPRPHIAFAADDVVRLDVNGVRDVAQGIDWQTARVAALPAAGPWVIGARAENITGPAGVAFVVRTPTRSVGSAAGVRVFVPSTPGAEPPPGWTLPGFDDGAWLEAVEVTSLGWADLGEEARWIWVPGAPLVAFFRVEIAP